MVEHARDLTNSEVDLAVLAFVARKLAGGRHFLDVFPGKVFCGRMEKFGAQTRHRYRIFVRLPFFIRRFFQRLKRLIVICWIVLKRARFHDELLFFQASPEGELEKVTASCECPFRTVQHSILSGSDMKKYPFALRRSFFKFLSSRLMSVLGRAPL